MIMKKILFVCLLCFTLFSCGVGTYSVSSGRMNEAAVVFTAKQNCAIKVTIDDVPFNVNAVKNKNWRVDRNIKKSARNEIRVKPGRHQVRVEMNGQEIFCEPLFLSVNETKIIRL